ncbi:unnamed protein product [Caenorhabditis brenneri]
MSSSSWSEDEEYNKNKKKPKKCSSSSEDDEYNNIEIFKYEKEFAKSDRTDAILVVQGNKLHVNKALLSYHSDFFKTLFNSDFKEKSMKEIEIKDVNFEDFATVLSLVQDNPLEINWKNAENLLKLADRFLLRGSKMHVERFIISINSQYFSRHEKLVLADKYNLENLLEHALGLYNNRAAFRDFHSYNIPISDQLRLKMFNDFFKKFGKSL